MTRAKPKVNTTDAPLQPRTAGRDLNERFQEILKEYAEKYDVASLSNPNDKANLHTMIKNQVVIESMQQSLYDLSLDDLVENAANMKRINDTIKDLSETNIQLERTLSIDRKSRRAEQENSVADYILHLKRMAREFLEDSDRLLRVDCKHCNILVGRISGVYDTTEYEARFQCPQCKQYIIVKRAERDIFYDVQDADWRRKYPIEIIHPKRTKSAPNIDMVDEVVIGEETPIEEVVEDGTDKET